MTNLIVSAALIFALHGAESDMRHHSKSGDHGRAHGVLQIHSKVLHDVDRIYGLHYTQKSTEREDTAEEICRLYLQYYGKEYKEHTGKPPSDEVLARIWNGGPTGYRKHRTKRYWTRRVQPYVKDYEKAHGKKR